MRPKLTRQSIQPFLLAGGLSARFGSDKSQVTIDGKSQLERLGNAIREEFACQPIVILRSDANQPILNPSTILDRIPSQGPLCGIATALNHLSCQIALAQTARSWAMMITCDQLVWTEQITTKMLDTYAKSPDAQAIIFEVDGFLQPFPSLWHHDLATIAHSAALSPQRSVSRLLKELPNIAICRLHDAAMLASFNTPHELAAWRKKLHDA